MNSRELMIDDIIQIKADDDCYQPLKVGSVEFDDLWCAIYNFERCEWENAYDGFGYDMVEPIPLTEEILMRNGFKRNEISIVKGVKEYYLQQSFCKGVQWCHVSTMLLKDSLFVDMEASDYSLFKKNVSHKFCKAECMVHELQHAFRLCGLHELADNFKVE